MFKWSAIINHFKLMRHYIAISAVIFLAGMMIGGTNPAFHQFIESQISSLGQLADKAANSPNPTLTMFTIIFFNNAIKAVLVMYFGALLGILPIIFLFVNGMVIGYFIQSVSQQHGFMTMLYEMVIKGILPHGWLEIPAIIIACAYGIRFGVIMLKLLGSGLFARQKAAANMKSLEYFLIRSVPVTIILVVVLLAAAIIESTITPWILGK